MKIAITGSIGSGKSSVGDYLRLKSFNVIDTDRLVHQLYLSGGVLYNSVLDAFGLDILDASGEIDRLALGKCVFNDPLALNDLESIVFPVVADYIQTYSADGQCVFFEVPMLFESEMDVYFDLILMIDTDQDIALERLEKRGIKTEDALKRLKLQMDPQLKIEKSDAVIHNNRDKAALFAAIDAYLREKEIAV